MMKNTNFIVFLFLLLLLSFSCTSSNQTPSNNSSNQTQKQSSENIQGFFEDALETIHGSWRGSGFFFKDSEREECSNMKLGLFLTEKSLTLSFRFICQYAVFVDEMTLDTSDYRIWKQQGRQVGTLATEDDTLTLFLKKARFKYFLEESDLTLIIDRNDGSLSYSDKSYTENTESFRAQMEKENS